ncbi:hypothetical protein BDV40DRAFT_278004 [Aspergillus tamarii]|uniref:Uncharacterized protein n=1 Tax=Aspergillus tamarii TaxID=41984 RepID=A0A5N6UGC8_ASPTM|nr:hypothetical protein BDV40DRAFT_278004 [Aspergillus tamarii]
MTESTVAAYANSPVHGNLKAGFLDSVDISVTGIRTSGFVGKPPLGVSIPSSTGIYIISMPSLIILERYNSLTLKLYSKMGM